MRNLPSDLKNFRDQNSFHLFSETEILVLLGICFAGALLLDLLARIFP